MSSAVIAASASGDNEIVAAVAGKKIRVVAGVLSFGGTVNAKWRSAATDISGLYYGILGTAVPFDYGPEGFGGMRGHLETATGEALNLNLSAGTAVGGHVVYEVVK